jgi:RimJ/RimL family protein N-acetyltransferase
MLIGKRISLRAIEVDDLELLRDWRNKEHFRKYFREYRELSLENQKNWYSSQVINNPNTLMFMVIDNSDMTPIGVTGLCYINWIHRHADLSIYIGKDDIYIDTERDGFSWQTLDTLFEYGFDQLNLHKIWTEIYSFDEKKHELFNRYGFHLDGELRDNYYYDGKYQDSHIFSIIAAEWRELYKHINLKGIQ